MDPIPRLEVAFVAQLSGYVHIAIAGFHLHLIAWVAKDRTSCAEEI
jgi:hypothetical protein